MRELLSCEGLHYHIAGRTLFHALALQLHAGEMLAIIGRNGAGKTTLLRQLTGDLPVQAGSIRLFGQPLQATPLRALARHRAVLSQSNHLHFGFSVIEVVLMGRIPHQHEPHAGTDDEHIASQALTKVGLAGYGPRNYLELSGGEQQRVHLARVLAQLEGPHPEKLLFLDEPTASLDIAHQHRTLGLAKDLCAAGGGALAILHDLNLAAQYADKILLLSGSGEYVFATADEVLTTDILSRAYEHDVRVIPHPYKRAKLVLS